MNTNGKRTLFVTSLFVFILSCNEVTAERCIYSEEEITRSMIRRDLDNFWSLCPVFNLTQAQQLSKENGKDILVIFYASLFSGNDSAIWEEINKEENSNLIRNRVIICPLNIEYDDNEKYQLLFTDSRELASIVIVTKDLAVVSDVVFFQGSSDDCDELKYLLGNTSALQGF
jgi:hypothetical protein